MSSRPSIHELLVKRNRRFLFSVILVIVFLFLVLQTIVLFHVHSSTQQFISNWLGKNQGRIEQALFLENSLGIQGVLGELEGLHDQAASIRVLRSDGRLAGESADKKVEGCFAQKAFSASGFEGFISHPLSRNLCYRGPLHFAERQYGWIEMSADYNLGSLLSNTLLCLVLSALVFMVVKRSATVLLRELNQSVVSPLSFFTGQMASQPTEIKDLSTLRRDAREFQFAPTEVLDLVDGYNGLIGKVHELSAKEAQRIELLSYSQVADQVSHDIRSPLAALNMVLKSLKDLPEEMRIILRSAAQRITDITNELQNQNKRVRASGSTIVQGSVSQGPVMLNALLDSIVSEKRTQFRENLEIEIQGEFEKGYGLFANINST